MSIYFEKARELGKMLLETKEGVRLENAKNAFAADAQAVQSFGEFSVQRARVQDSINRGEMTQEEYNNAIADLTEKTVELKKNPVIAELNDAETEFYAHVNQVLEVVKSTITGQIEEDDCGCGGGCSSGGCGGDCGCGGK